MGAPPAEAVLATLTGRDTVPDELVRARRWLVAISIDAAPTWHAADAQIPLVPASQDGVMVRASAASYGGSGSPIDGDTLAPLTPLEAATRVATWRPPTSTSFMDPNAEGLASALSQLIDANLEDWLATDAVTLAQALHEPIYITVFIHKMGAHVKRVADRADRLIELTELVCSEPWSPADIAADLFAPGRAPLPRR